MQRKIRVTDHGVSLFFSYYNGDPGLWKPAQGLAEQVQLPDFADSIEDFTEEDSNSDSMATGRSPKLPRTESAENGLDIASLMEKVAEKAGDRAAEKSSEGFRTYMDTKIDSMMEQMDKKIDDKINKKLVPVIDRISALEEKTLTSSTRSGPSSSSDGTSGSAAGPVLFAPSYLEIKGWCAFKDRDTHGLTEGQSKEFIAKLRQLDSTGGCCESQEHKDYMLLEEPKRFKL